MPFVSDKQRRFMNWAAANGKIKKNVVDEFNKASKGLNLPEQVTNNSFSPQQPTKIKKPRFSRTFKLYNK